jgi:hypothetical protein
MEINLRDTYTTVSRAVMMRRRFYYLDSETRRELDAVLEGYIKNPAGDSLWTALCSKLPLEKKKSTSYKTRVEGLSYAAESLWDTALARGKLAYGENFGRQELSRAVGSRPISYYHYLIGSREPRTILNTRRDALEDLDTAMLKLKDDIMSLADFIRRLPSDITGIMGSVNLTDN